MMLMQTLLCDETHINAIDFWGESRIKSITIGVLIIIHYIVSKVMD